MDKNNLFECIKSHVSILQVVSEHVALKKAGNYWKGKCPFHDEKTASFTVSPHMDIFYCFGCHASGDVISFVEKRERCTALEAAHFLADHYNVELPENNTSVAQERVASGDEKKRYFLLCSLVAHWCHEQLKKRENAKKYILERGFTEKSVQQFSIGYFPGGMASIKDLCKFIAEYHFLAKDLLHIHVLEESKATLYSPFEERILFPIKDHMGRFCGFGGRVFKSQDERSKYYNSRENSFFQKGSLLFGFDQAKKEIQKTGKVFLVEGYTDCIAMVQHGIINTVATLGTACTVEHLKALSYHAHTVYVVYDGDMAGHNAMLRLVELCWQVDLELKVVQLPEGDDPASLLFKGGDSTVLFSQASDIFSFFLHAKSDNFNGLSLADKLGIVRHFLTIIGHLSDPLKQDILLEQAAHSFSMPLVTLKKEMVRLRGPHLKKNNEAFKPADEKNEGQLLSALEKKVICGILNNHDLVHTQEVRGLILYMPELMRALLEKWIVALQGDEKQSFSRFFSSLSSVEKGEVSALLMAQSVDEGETFADKIALLEKAYWKVIVKTTKLKIEQAQKENDAQKVNELVGAFLRLKKKVLGKE